MKKKIYLCIYSEAGKPTATHLKATSKYEAYHKLKMKGYRRIYYIFSPSEYKKADVDYLKRRYAWQ